MSIGSCGDFLALNRSFLEAFVNFWRLAAPLEGPL
jgi:hypothetical protein